MDAKITKQRLGNLLSYDWLKILCAIAAAVVALVLFFTMVRTRPGDDQVFTVFGYQVYQGAIGETDLDKDKIFSYEILETGSETFDAKTSYLFSVRRSVNEGSVMFVSDLVRNEGTEEETTDLLSVTGGAEGTVALNTETYLNDCKAYLARFFGEDLGAEEPDAELTRETFLARNAKDKCFRTSAKKEAGIVLEQARLIKLREDYFFVLGAIESGKLSHKVIETEGKSTPVAFNLGKLNKISKLYYCGEHDKPQDALNLIILNNRNPQSDLRYEAVSYLKYLVEKYGE